MASQLTVTQRSLRLAASTETTNVHQNGGFNIILKVLDADGTVAQNLKWRVSIEEFSESFIHMLWIGCILNLIC